MKWIKAKKEDEVKKREGVMEEREMKLVPFIVEIKEVRELGIYSGVRGIFENERTWLMKFVDCAYISIKFISFTM